MFDLFGSLSSTMGVDLGTANTLIYTKENGIIVREPSLVARHKKTGRILAVGSEAKQMEGRTPDFLETLHPLRDGVIADFDVTAAMLRIFLKKALRGRKFVQPTLVVSVPCGVTAVERRAVIDAATQAGARDAYLIEEPLAAALGADMPGPGSGGKHGGGPGRRYNGSGGHLHGKDCPFPDAPIGRRCP